MTKKLLITSILIGALSQTVYADLTSVSKIKEISSISTLKIKKELEEDKKAKAITKEFLTFVDKKVNAVAKQGYYDSAKIYLNWGSKGNKQLLKK